MHPLVEAMADMKEQEALRLVDELLAQGEEPQKILDLSSQAMQVVESATKKVPTSSRN